jgi:hypothetical protein
MIVVMSRISTRLIAKCILHSTGVIQHFMYQATIEKGFKRSINCNTIERVFDFVLNVGMGQRVISLEKQLQYLLANRCRPKLEIFQYRVRNASHYSPGD